MGLWPRSKLFLDGEDEAWQRATWAWFLDEFGNIETLRRTPLVTPSRGFFPPTEATGHERAAHVFACIKQLAGMTDLPCRLEAQPDRPATQVGEFALMRFDKVDPAGTFSADENEVLVTYDPSSVGDPLVLVATLAHELCHYRLALARSPTPGGREMHEPATDLATVHLGFGLFGANCAFRFAQHGDAFAQGWRSSSLGYLDERSWCYALAMFLVLRGEPIETARPFLKPHLFSDLRAAETYLRRHPDRLPGA